MSKTMLDAIVNNTTDAREPLAERWPNELAGAPEPTSTLVPGEDDTTTHRALSEMYDRKRDAQLMALAKIVGTYGDEMNKREMSAANAAPLLAEMRKALDRADVAQRKSASHRAAEQAAATRQ